MNSSPSTRNLANLARDLEPLPPVGVEIDIDTEMTAFHEEALFDTDDDEMPPVQDTRSPPEESSFDEQEMWDAINNSESIPTIDTIQVDTTVHDSASVHTAATEGTTCTTILESLCGSKRKRDDVEMDEVSVLSNPITTDTNQPSDTDDLDDLLGSVQSNNSLLSKGIITVHCESNTPDPKMLEPKELLGLRLLTCLNMWSGQFEICPTTGQLHFHIAYEFKSKKRPKFDRVCTKIRSHPNVKGVNIRKATSSSKNSEACRINYCLDPEKRAPGTEPFEWANNTKKITFNQTVKDKRKAKRSKTDKKKDAEAEIIAYIESKPAWWSWADILHENAESKALLFSCSHAPRFHKLRSERVVRRKVEEVEIYYGCAGTGKTTCVLMNNPEDPCAPPNVYTRNNADGDFWGGGATAYKNESIINFEEFEGQYPLSSLKEVANPGHVGPNVNIKNGGVKLNHSKVIICSNSHPAGWYRGVWAKDPKLWEPFRRRITKVLFFPEFRPDGSRNKPDADNTPYIIDQTEDWKTFEGEEGLVKAAEHAAIHWPLKDADSGGEFRDGFNAHNLRN